MLRFWRVLMVLIAWLTQACLGPSEPPPPPPPPPPPVEVDLDEVVVETAPETSRAVTATVDEAGGEVAATASDGTTYALRIPAGALTGPTDITVTPAGDVDGLDDVADEVIAGVDFAPDGLQFELPSFLEVALPAGRTLPDGAVFAATHEADEPGLALPPSIVADDGTSVRVQVDHFSGATIWTGSPVHLATLFEAAVTALPTQGELVPELVAAATAVGTGATTSQATYVALVVQAYQQIVLPLVEEADQSIDGLIPAYGAALKIRGITEWVQQLAGPGPLPAPIGVATTARELGQLGVSQVVEAAERLRDTYLPPQCTATVGAVEDWIVLPLFFQTLNVFLGTVAQTPDRLCVEPVVTGPTFDPPTVVQSDRYVGMTAQVVTAVPAQTPMPAGSNGETLPDGRFALTTPTEFSLNATGGGFVVGDVIDPLLIAERADGSLSVSIDRGADPEARTVDVSVAGSALVSGPLSTFASDIVDYNLVPIGGAASGELDLQVVRWDGPPPAVPVDQRILEPGGTTRVCVEVRNRVGVAVPGVPVTFQTDGPGSIVAGPPVMTSDSQLTPGVACVDYTHPEQLVPAGLAAVIEVEANDGPDDVGRAEITLQPREADIALAARVLPDGAFVPVTNGTFTSPAGQAVEVRATLRGSGETPDDPLVPLDGAEVVATLDDGNGLLLVGEIPEIPLILTTGASGTATFRWEPNGDEPATVRVAHPSEGAGVAATVTVGPDPTTIDGDLIVRTQAELDELEGVTTVNGSLRVGWYDAPSDIADLSPLSGLTSVSGVLDVGYNPELADLDGLDGLTSVGGRFGVGSNPLVASLDPLASLESVGGLTVGAMPSLTDLDGLDGLTQVTGTLSIASNDALTDISALSGVTGVVGDILLRRNPVLATLDGLQGITAATGGLYLDAPALISMDGLASLTSIGGEVEINNHPEVFASMPTFRLPLLTSIGSNLDITGTAYSTPDTAGSLRTFDLPALREIGGRLQILHHVGVPIELITAPDLEVGSFLSVERNRGAVISATVGSVEDDLIVGGNEDGQVRLTVGTVGQTVTVFRNVRTDLQLDVGTVERDVTIGNVRNADEGNVDISLAGIDIGSAGPVWVYNNSGFTDDQAFSWAEGITTTFRRVSGNRP